jgi:hypothetical protein
LHCFALTLDLRGRALEDVLEALARRPVQGVEDLVEVDLGGRVVGGDRAAVVDRRVGDRSDPQVHVAIGDPRERGLANRRLGALAQRLVIGLVDAEGQLGLAVRSQGDVGDRPDRVAGHLDEIAAHDLAGVLEDRLDRVGRAAGEHDDPDRHHRDDDRRDGRDPDDQTCRTHRPDQFKGELLQRESMRAFDQRKIDREAKQGPHCTVNW